MFGQLTVITGGMFAGKTSELIRFGERYALANKEVVYIKPSLDNRYSANKIVTHSGKEVGAFKINTKTDSIIDFITRNTKAVLVDEVQFFSKEITSDIDYLLSNGVSVIVSGLDLDSNFNGFEITKELMARADVIVKLRAVCELCGEDGIVSAKRKENTNVDRIQVGEKESYIPLCRNCYAAYKEDK